VRVDPDGAVSVAADDIWFPNGTVITPDGKTLIIGESLGDRLSAFDIAEDGTLSSRRVWADLGTDGFPDGICLDAEGAVWVASPRINKLRRVFQGGKIAIEIDFGTVKPVACALGGNDRKTLYLLTNTHVGLASATAMGGKVEALRVDVPGVGLP
jgi:sugar lactone lactonase YvrE